MDNEMLNEISEDLLQCSICMDKYDQPKLLPCIHTFCESCLEEYTKRPGGKSFSCPTCRTSINIPEGGIKSFPTNFYIGNLEEKIRKLEGGRNSPQAQKCGQCGNAGVDKFCKDCNCSLCEDCIYAHTKWQMLKDHVISDLTPLEGSMEANAKFGKDKNMCQNHNGELLYLYCKTCGMMICRKCAACDHPKPEHDYITAATEVVKTRQTLGQLLNKSDDMLALCSKFERLHFVSIEKLYEDIQTIENAIKKATDDAHMLIQSQHFLLMVEMNKMKQERINRIHSSLMETRSLRNHVEISQDLINKLMSKTMGPLELLNVGGYLKDTFSNLQKYADNVAHISSEASGSVVSFSPFQATNPDRNLHLIGQIFSPVCVEAKVADLETLDLIIATQDEGSLGIYIGRLLKLKGYNIRHVKWILKHEWEASFGEDVSKYAICMAIEPAKHIFLAQGKRIAVVQMDNGKVLCSNEASGRYQPYSFVSCIDYDEGTGLIFVGDEGRRIEALNPLNNWHVSFFIEIPNSLVCPTRLVAHKSGGIFLSNAEPCVFQANFRKQCGRLEACQDTIAHARPVDIARSLSSSIECKTKDQTLYQNGRIQGRYPLKQASVQLKFSWFVLWVNDSAGSDGAESAWVITEYLSSSMNAVAVLKSRPTARVPVAMVPISRDDGMEIIVVDKLMNFTIFWRNILDPENSEPSEYTIKSHT